MPDGCCSNSQSLLIECSSVALFGRREQKGSWPINQIYVRLNGVSVRFLVSLRSEVHSACLGKL